MRWEAEGRRPGTSSCQVRTSSSRAPPYLSAPRLPASGTGLTSTPKHTQAWRTANWHMTVMLTVTAIVVVDIIVRLSNWDSAYTGLATTILSVLAAALVSFGATYGGCPDYDYGLYVGHSCNHPGLHE